MIDPFCKASRLRSFEKFLLAAINHGEVEHNVEYHYCHDTSVLVCQPKCIMNDHVVPVGNYTQGGLVKSNNYEE
jgi:hypothetical protein